MKINYLQISNVLSFENHDDVSNAQEIKFYPDLNILIGQNGSGKSTCLEILNFLYQKILFPRHDFNQNNYLQKNILSQQARNQIITKDESLEFKNFRLDPHWDFEEKPQKIRVSISLDSVDESNINLLNEHHAKLKKIADLYSKIDLPTNFKMIENEIIIDIELNYTDNKFTTTILQQEQNPGFIYLVKYNFCKELIILYNLENQAANIPLIQESFLLIGCFRNYNAFNPSILLSNNNPLDVIRDLQIREKQKSVNAIETQEPAIFTFVRLKIAQKYLELSDEKLNKEECETEANNLEILKKINNKLNLINLECKIKLIEKRTWQFSFEFIDKKRNKILPSINSLSAGQKSITHLVFEAYGRGNIKGGLIIIDEPEIHLHYQFQHEYLRIIHDINKTQNCQYILVTHSESLINSLTINSVKRFYLDEHGNSKVNSPKLETKQSTLIRILDNTKSTYAFFSKKIILVEGYTDQYLITALLSRLKPELAQEVAILDIKGKGEYKNWKILFESFGLHVVYLGDFDNAYTLKYDDHNTLLDRTECEKIKNQYPNNYLTFVSEVKNKFSDTDEKIESLYKDNIFILKQGEIENYIGLIKPHSGMEDFINFCETKMDNWIESTDQYFQELETIIKRIIT